MGIYLGGSSISGVMSGAPTIATEDVWERVLDYIIPEDNTATMWTWTENENGEPFAYKKLVVRLYSMVGDGTQSGNIELVYNWKSLCYAKGCVSTSGERVAAFIADTYLSPGYGQGRVWDVRCTTNAFDSPTAQSTWSTRGYGVPFYNSDYTFLQSGIDQISIRGALPAGSIILIYGVRV